MTANTNRIIEIDGIKMEVDLRSAKRIDTFNPGDAVRILVKPEYSGSQAQVFTGCIVDFEDFRSMPTITVAYIETSYSAPEIKLAYINEKNAGRYELIHCDTETMRALDHERVIDTLEGEINKAQAALEQAKAKKHFFLSRFAALITKA